MIRLLRQDTATVEIRAVGQAAMLADVPTRVVALESLTDHKEALIAGAVPIGSVEFVREAMRVAGIIEPENLSYPEVLREELQRNIKLCRAGDVVAKCFVKPATTKLFNGFVFDPGAKHSDLDEHDLEQLNAFIKADPLEWVWTSPVVRFVSEWRYYVHEGNSIGFARYDPDGPAAAQEPDAPWVARTLSKFEAAHDVAAYAIDVGRLDDGRLALVEVNDFWAIGLYGRAIAADRYLKMLTDRWQQIHGAQCP